MRPNKALAFAQAWLAATLISSTVQAQVAFPGVEFLGRPTDRAVTLNVVPNAAIDAYVEYGTQSGGPYALTSPAAGAAGPASTAANVPLVVLLNGLEPNTRYFYRLVHRPAGTSSWTSGTQYSFHTQRAPGSTFSFTLTSDSHINNIFGNTTLFQRNLQNIAGAGPDFSVDLGDTFAMDSVTTQAAADGVYLNMRSYFGLISHSVPVFLALGNHAQEEAWHLDDTGNAATSQPVLGANARKKYFPNPDPLLDSFYTGNTDTSHAALSGHHAVEDYYAWQWGDALFVVYDPYWYTYTKPYTGNNGGGESSDPGSGDRWDWTLGSDQYLWLKQTLENSTATYKFLFAHQVAGGTDDYGRGGANAVPYAEWGGFDENGTTQAFATKRPGWDSPIHSLLVANNVTAVFLGHDHQFAHEERDGVVYQHVPMAADASYGNGHNTFRETDPFTIKVLPNSGHLRVTVSPAQVSVDYVRAYLAGDGTNGQIAYSYAVAPPSTTPDFSVAASPSAQSVVRGGSASYTVSTGVLNGFVGEVVFDVAGLPSGVTGTFTPVSVIGVGASVLNVATSPTTPVGTYTLTITGTSASLVHSANVTLTVTPEPDFTVGVTPATQLVSVGGSASYTVTVTGQNGFTGSVGFAVSGLPAGATSSFNPTTVTGTGSTSLTVTVGSGTAPGSSSIQVTGTSGSLSRQGTATLTVVGGGGAGSLTGSSQTPSGTQNLSTLGTVDWAHWGLTSATSFNHKSGVTQQISNFAVVGTGPAGRFADNDFGFTWTGGTPTASATNSPTGVYVGGVGNGFRITVPAATTQRTLRVYVAAYNAQGSLVAHLSDGSAVDYVDNGANASNDNVVQRVYTLAYQAATAGQTLTVTFTNALASGAGTAIGLEAATLTGAAPSPDFTLGVTPAAQSVAVGGSATYTVAVTGQNGFSGTVGFAVSGLPSGATSSFNPTTVTGTGSTTLTVTVGGGTAPGSSSLQVTGTSGSLSRQGTATLTVVGGGGTGSLSGSSQTPSGTQNLSTLGTVDWAHWGLTSATSFSHKSGVTQQISNFAVVGTGPAGRFADNDFGFTWTGGTPTASATNSPTGVYVGGVGNGFRITVPAATTQRTLRVYVAAYNAQGSLVAHLSDGSAVDYVDNGADASNDNVVQKVYTLAYQAATAGQTLTVTFTNGLANGPEGAVALEAATLQ